VNYLNSGRQGLTIDGQEHEGHISHDRGLNGLMALFTEACGEKDLEAMIIAENAYLREELALCEPDNPITIASLAHAVASFDDALRVLSVVSKESYRDTEKSYPRNAKYRVKGSLPKDAFHTACIANKTRIKNFLSAPGINPVLRELSHKRIEIMKAAQEFYIEKQQAVLK
jgi:hypothetical protein